MFPGNSQPIFTMTVIKEVGSLILNLIFLVTFLVHVFSIGYNLNFPDNPNTRIFERDLKTIEFPISIKLCISELENYYKRYEELGYKDDKGFFLGISMFEGDRIGWNGHNKNNTSLGSIEGNT